MKKVSILLLLVLFITTSAYAVSIFDTILCEKVVLHLINRVVLVNRITGEVKYTLTQKGTWVLLTGPVKAQYQSMYNAQVKAR
ncbi:MAG TPA: hypothetical protein VMD04_01025 [Candidatus Margulisiibacteriota bacterium]|nr:hypothetical protein [Candidatus Margulisiibacteriota bacterium]